MLWLVVKFCPAPRRHRMTDADCIVAHGRWASWIVLTALRPNFGRLIGPKLVPKADIRYMTAPAHMEESGPFASEPHDKVSCLSFISQADGSQKNSSEQVNAAAYWPDSSQL